jgi:hypothetical protein
MPNFLFPFGSKEAGLQIWAHGKRAMKKGTDEEAIRCAAPGRRARRPSPADIIQPYVSEEMTSSNFQISWPMHIYEWLSRALEEASLFRFLHVRSNQTKIKKGPKLIQLYSDWAPLGSEAFGRRGSLHRLLVISWWNWTKASYLSMHAWQNLPSPYLLFMIWWLHEYIWSIYSFSGSAINNTWKVFDFDAWRRKSIIVVPACYLLLIYIYIYTPFRFICACIVNPGIKFYMHARVPHSL